MPELPDILVYVDALSEFVVGATLERARVRSPSLLHTYEPSLLEAEGKRVAGVRRIGKRLVLELEGELFLVFHLMIAGRFHWKKPRAMPTGKYDHAAFGFEHGTLMLTEHSPKKRAELHVVRGEAPLEKFALGGVDALSSTAEEFREALVRENHTLKRSLTDPRLFDGIGNAYSDEILHAARLSPLTWTTRLSSEEISR